VPRTTRGKNAPPCQQLPVHPPAETRKPGQPPTRGSCDRPAPRTLLPGGCSVARPAPRHSTLSGVIWIHTCSCAQHAVAAAAVAAGRHPLLHNCQCTAATRAVRAGKPHQGRLQLHRQQSGCPPEQPPAAAAGGVPGWPPSAGPQPQPLRSPPSAPPPPAAPPAARTELRRCATRAAGPTCARVQAAARRVT
jgi:hypothetical protein